MTVWNHIWKSMRPLFNYLSVAKEERFTKQVPLKPRKYNYKWLSIAAVAVLALGTYFGPGAYRDYHGTKGGRVCVQ